MPKVWNKRDPNCPKDPFVVSLSNHKVPNRDIPMLTYSGSIQFYDVGLDAESHRAFPGSLDDTSNIEMSQAYFWTEEWQQGERRAEADIDAGRITWLAGTDIDAHFEVLTKQARLRSSSRNRRHS